MKSFLSPSPTLKILENTADKAKKQFKAAYNKITTSGEYDIAVWLIEQSGISTLRQVLDQWLVALPQNAEDKFALGSATALIEFDSYLAVLEQVSDSFWKEDGEAEKGS